MSCCWNAWSQLDQSQTPVQLLGWAQPNRSRPGTGHPGQGYPGLVGYRECFVVATLAASGMLVKKMSAPMKETSPKSARCISAFLYKTLKEDQIDAVGRLPGAREFPPDESYGKVENTGTKSFRQSTSVRRFPDQPGRISKDTTPKIRFV